MLKGILSYDAMIDVSSFADAKDKITIILF